LRAKSARHAKARVRVRDPLTRGGPTGPTDGPGDCKAGPHKSTSGPYGPSPRTDEEMNI